MSTKSSHREYAKGTHAIAECQRSGQKMRYRDLVEDGHVSGLLVHPDWWEPKHPQEIPVEVTDPIALFRPAPEISIPAGYGDPEGIFTFTGLDGDGAAYLDGGNIAAFNFDENSSFTVEFRVKGSGVINVDQIMHKSSATVGWAISSDESTGTVGVITNDGSLAVDLSVHGILPDNGAWYHLAFAFDRNVDLCFLYVEGVLKESLTIRPGSYVSSAPFQLFRGRTDLTKYFGSLDDVRLWSGARTANQINNNKNVSLTGTESGLLSNWKLDGTVGAAATVVTDATGNNNLTLIPAGGALTYVSGTSPTAPFGFATATGTINQALSGSETQVVLTDAVKHLFGQWLFIELNVSNTFFVSRITTAAESPTFTLPFTTAFPATSAANIGNSYYITQSGDPFDGGS